MGRKKNKKENQENQEFLNYRSQKKTKTHHKKLEETLDEETQEGKILFFTKCAKFCIIILNGALLLKTYPNHNQLFRLLLMFTSTVWIDFLEKINKKEYKWNKKSRFLMIVLSIFTVLNLGSLFKFFIIKNEIMFFDFSLIVINTKMNVKYYYLLGIIYSVYFKSTDYGLSYSKKEGKNAK